MPLHHRGLLYSRPTRNTAYMSVYRYGVYAAVLLLISIMVFCNVKVSESGGETFKLEEDLSRLNSIVVVESSDPPTQEVVSNIPHMSRSVPIDDSQESTAMSLTSSDSAEESPPSDYHFCNDVVINTAEDQAIPIYYDVAMSGFVKEDEYKYYQVCVATHADHDHNIAFQLTAVSGDPDLYLSPTNERPDKVSSLFISADPGTDLIEIPSSHFDIPKDAHIMFMGVYGREASEYTLSVKISPLKPKVSLSFLRGQAARASSNSHGHT